MKAIEKLRLYLSEMRKLTGEDWKMIFRELFPSTRSWMNFQVLIMTFLVSVQRGISNELRFILVFMMVYCYNEWRKEGRYDIKPRFK